MGTLEGTARKTRFREERESLLNHLRARPSGRAAAASLTRQVDELVRRVFHDCEPPAATTAVALGGYGREHLAPFSDIDLLVLFGDPSCEAAAAPFATRFFQALWDLGLNLGHSARSVEDAARTLTRDLKSATALVEARLLAGSAETFSRFDESRRDFLARMGDAFLAAKRDEALARHARTGGSPFTAEPYVKEGPGGLRDVELLRLFRLAGSPPVGIPLLDPEGELDLEDAEERLLETRLLMHALEGKRADRLGFELATRVAQAFGFRDSHSSTAVEAFMQDYYRSAKTVDRARRLAFHALEARLAERTELAAHRRPRRVSERFVAVGEALELARPGALAAAAPDPGPLFELFLVAQREKLDPVEPALEEVRSLLPRVTQAERESPALAGRFRSLLSGRTRVAASLRLMNRAGLLSEYLPEFGTLEGLWQLDPYHEFTVDEHSLRCLDALEGFIESKEREDELRAEVLGRQRRLDVLRLAVLLHDMGKGKGGAHVEVGTAMVPDVARRLGLDLEEGRLFRFLVEHHLEMSRTIELRDFTSPATLAAFCDLVGDEERLDMLYLLTAADMRGVGSRAFPRWKDALLTNLYQLALERLRGGGEHPPLGAEERRREVIARLPEGVTTADFERHLELAPRRYQLEIEPFDVALHLRLIRDLARGRDPATARVVDGPLRHFWICTRDRPGLFARVAGVLAARGARILTADAYTRRDGIVLDKLTLEIAPELADDDAFWEELERTLGDVLAGRKEVAELVEKARARVPYREARKGPPVPTVVKCSNKLSDRYTVIDVGVEDRVGLLYDLAHRITELGLDIHYAKISTRANRAVDVFYVTRDGAKVIDPHDLEGIEAALGGV